MIRNLSRRAFRHLRLLDQKLGLGHTDAEIYELGARLVNLCHVATEVEEIEARRLRKLLTDTEVKAVNVLREHLAGTGRLCSARELSRALGYQSSRSGFLLLQRLRCKGVLLKLSADLALSQKFERCLEGSKELAILEGDGGKDGEDDLSLDFQGSAGE